MSEQAPAKKRGAGKDPEFMKKMRERAAVVRQQNASIRAAEKLKQKKEHERQVKEAQDYLNPPPVQEVKPEPEPEPEVDDEPEVTKPAPRKRAPRATVEQDEPDYKQEYYKQKLELLKIQKLQQEAPATKEAPPQPQAHPYDLAKHDIHKHVNKAVMDNLWRTYFPAHASPYS